MSQTRCLVTGHNNKGQSTVASDGPVGSINVPGMNGVEITQLWGADTVLRFPDNGAPPPFTTFFPPRDGFRFMLIVIPPDSDPVTDADTGDINTLFPGLADTMLESNPGMHRSQTIDLLYVLEGEVILELDDGSHSRMSSGDAMVQNGTMHAWRNPSDTPCRMLGISIGAEHSAP